MKQNFKGEKLNLPAPTLAKEFSWEFPFKLKKNGMVTRLKTVSLWMSIILATRNVAVHLPDTSLEDSFAWRAIQQVRLMVAPAICSYKLFCVFSHNIDFLCERMIGVVRISSIRKPRESRANSSFFVLIFICLRFCLILLFISDICKFQFSLRTISILCLIQRKKLLRKCCQWIREEYSLCFFHELLRLSTKVLLRDSTENSHGDFFMNYSRFFS